MLASHHKIIKYSEQTHMHVVLQGPEQKKKKFLNCFIKPLLIPYSKSLKTGEKNSEKRTKNSTKKSRERRESREQEGERKTKPDIRVT